MAASFVVEGTCRCEDVVGAYHDPCSRIRRWSLKELDSILESKRMAAVYQWDFNSLVGVE